MVNILLTNKCVRECPYCFAGEEMTQSPGTSCISWEDIIYLADLLEAGGERRVSLLGGEPTLHPDFLDILLYMAERQFHVNVFTSGLMSKAKLDELKKHIDGMPRARINFVCNINNPEQTGTPDSETRKLHEFLAALGPWTMPGFNIYRTDFEIDFLFDLVARYGMKKKLRLGITHPVPGGGNKFIRTEDIDGVLARLFSFRADFERLRLQPSLDCGFPLCRVSDEQLGWLMRLSGDAAFKCRPALDITPDMQVYCCFPLAGLQRKSVYEFDSFRQMVDHFEALQKQLRSEIAGIYDECTTCPHRLERTCAGGGACRIACRLAQEAPAKLAEIGRGHDETCVPV